MLNHTRSDSTQPFPQRLQNSSNIHVTAQALPSLKLTNQQGFTALMVILVLLIGLTTVSLTTTRSGMLEQFIAGNDIRAKEAQEAAEAALEFGIAWTTTNAIPWENNADPLVDCSTDIGCPVFPGSLTGNDGGAISVVLRLERNPATPNYIKMTATATQTDNASRAIYSSYITQDGTRIPGTWRDF